MQPGSDYRRRETRDIGHFFVEKSKREKERRRNRLYLCIFTKFRPSLASTFPPSFRPTAGSGRSSFRPLPLPPPPQIRMTNLVFGFRGGFGSEIAAPSVAPT